MPQGQGYSTGGPSGGVDHQIGPSPGSMQLLRQLASRRSNNWGETIGQLGAAFALRHAKTKAEEVRLQKQAETREMRPRNNFLSGLKVRDEGARTC